ADVPALQAEGGALGLHLLPLLLVDRRRSDRRVERQGVGLAHGLGAPDVAPARLGVRHAGAAADALPVAGLNGRGRYLPDAKGGPGLINPGRISLSNLVLLVGGG